MGEGGPGGETDASFSPDGKSLVYGVQMADQTVSGQNFGLGIRNLISNQVTALAGSEGLWSARWSPDGRSIAALGFPNRLWLYRLATKARQQLIDFGTGFPSWARDGRRIYFEDSNTTTWYRFTLAGRKWEAISSLRGLRMAPFSLGRVGLDANDGLISARDTSTVSIYALDLVLPRGCSMPGVAAIRPRWNGCRKSFMRSCAGWPAIICGPSARGTCCSHRHW